MKSNMKKIMALFLAFVLAFIPIGDIAQVKAETTYQDVTLTGLYSNTSFDDTNQQIVLWFTTTGGTWSNDWTHWWEPFKYEVNGVEKQAKCTQSAGTDLLYVTIPYSDVSPTAGNKITIKKGEYATTDIETDPTIRLQNDFEIVFTSDRPVVPEGYKIIDVEDVSIAHGDATQIIVDLKDKEGTAITFGRHTEENWNAYMLTPAYADGTRMINTDWPTTKNGVFQNDSHIAYWENGNSFKEINTGRFWIGGLSATEGTTVTIKGAFANTSVSGDWIDVDKCIFKEFRFTYTGGTWVFSKPYQDVTITSLFYAQDENGDDIRTRITSTEVQLWLNIESDAWSTEDWKDWESQWYKFVYEINGVKKNAAIVQAAGTNLLYVTIPLSDITTEAGTKITIKAGEYSAYTNTDMGINLLNDFEILFTCDMPVAAEGYKIIDVGSTNIALGDASQIIVNLKDKTGNAITFGRHTDGEENWGLHMLTPATVSGARMEEADWSNTKNGVFQNGNHIAYWSGGNNFKEINTGLFYIGGLSAEEGTVVTIKGAFADTDTTGAWADVGKCVFKEFSFTYTNGAWVSSIEPEITYTDYTGTPEFKEGDGANGFYFTAGETEFPYDSNGGVVATAVDDDSKVYVDGEPTDIKLKKVGEDLWYVCVEEAGITLEDGDVVNVTGTFVYETHRITFDGEVEYTYEAPTYEGTPVLAPADNYGNSNGFYVYCDDGAPKTDWGTYYYAQDGDNAGVSVQTSSGTTTYKTISLQKNEANMWYVWLAQESSLSLAYGDIVSIEGSFASEAGTVVTFNKASFQYDGKHFSQGTFEATDIEVKDVYYYETVFANNCWNIYFTSSAELPGDANTTYYPNMTCVINNEVEYVSNWFKTGCTNTIDNVTYTTFLIQIPSEKLPQNLEDKYVITLKVGAAQGRTANSGEANDYGLDTAHTTGIRLTKEFSFEVGDRYEASAPTVDYGNTSNIGSTDVDTTNKTTKYLWLTTSDDFPVTSWIYVLTKTGDDSGIFLRNSETGEYESTDGQMKRHQSGAYCVENFGTVETGDIIMLKGTFSMSNLHFITFGTARYQWTGEKWIVYSEIEKEDSTGIDGDARGDNNLNSADLVRMLNHIKDKEAYKISLLDADLNATGDIDEYDVKIERKLLLGLTLYQGTPTYEDDAEMRLAAFVAPTLDEGFELYSEAGFNTIIGEQRAVTESTGTDEDDTDADEFDAYMKAANDAGLDVLVQSGAITNMINNGSGYSSEVVQSEYEKASEYDNFRGFFMADEPNYSNLNILGQISSALRALANAEEDPEKQRMDLFIAGHPMYTENEIWDATAGLSDSDAYYRYAENIGNSLGEYTYDFYPFRHKYKTSILGTKYNHQDYMEDQWLLNLKVAANASKNSEGAFDTGMVIQSYSEPADGDYLREVGQKEISAQVYAALAYGMKSLNYFTYGKHWDTEKAPTESCMTNNQDIYDAVATVNKAIQKFDHVMLKYNWVGTMGIAGDYSNGNITQMDADGTTSHASKRISTWSSKNAADSSENADAIIGCLKDLNGYDGFMIVNVAVADSDVEITENISVTFKETKADGSVLTSTHAMVYKDGEMSTVTLDDGTYTTTLTPGQGIFVIPYIQ